MERRSALYLCASLAGRGARNPGHSPYGAPPRLALRRDGAGFVIEVADEGPGLSAEARAHLFEAFARGDGAKGSGLGLAVAREIVVRHGGRLDVSGPPGCRVTIELPA